MAVKSTSSRNGGSRKKFAPAVAPVGKKSSCIEDLRRRILTETLQPGESRQMPVVFVIESGLPKDVGTITLSYSFFEVEGAGKKAG